MAHLAKTGLPRQHYVFLTRGFSVHVPLIPHGCHSSRLFLWLVLLCLPAHAIGTHDLPGRALRFDIPAQNLSSALKEYAHISQRPILIRSELVQNLRSNSVHGHYTPEQALQQILQRTSLQAVRIQEAGQYFDVIRPVPKPDDSTLFGTGLQGYPGLVQQQVWQRLCSDTQTAPGSYRSLIQLNINRQGQITEVRLLMYSGPPALENTITARLRQWQLNAPPPARLPQPISLLIEPTADGSPATCPEHHD